MSRPLRIEYAGAFYHVYSRGDGKRPIFVDDIDRRVFLKTLRSVVECRGWICHAYCLLFNHYHLLLETPSANLSQGMRDLNGNYSQAFNRRHGNVGHVLQGRFHSPLVTDDEYFLVSARYIVLNPVESMVVERPSSWQWSSYRAMVGLASRPSFLETRYTLGIFSDDFAIALEEYQRFVQDGLKKSDCIDTDLAILGRPPVNESVALLLRCKRKASGISRAQKYADRLPLQEILRSFRNKRERDPLILCAYNENGYSTKEIADYLGVSSSTVSRVIKAARDTCSISR